MPGVSIFPPAVNTASIKAGTPVRSREWSALAREINHVLGRGAVLVPMSGQQDTLAAGSYYMYSFRLAPRYQATRRYWLIKGYSAGTGTAQVDVQIPDGTDAITDIQFTPGTSQIPEQMYAGYEDVARSSAVATTTVRITVASGGDDFILTGISCIEVPRRTLDTSNDLGIEPSEFAIEQPIWANSAGSAGAYRVFNALSDTGAIGRRAGLYHWCVPYNQDASEITSFAESAASGTFSDVMDLYPPVLGRALNIDMGTGVAATTKTINWAVFYKTSAASGVEASFRLGGTRSGNTTTLTFQNSATWTWTATQTLSVDSEDLTQSDGRRSSTTDRLRLEFARAGSGTVYVGGLAVWEPA